MTRLHDRDKLLELGGDWETVIFLYVVIKQTSVDVDDSKSQSHKSVAEETAECWRRCCRVLQEPRQPKNIDTLVSCCGEQRLLKCAVRRSFLFSGLQTTEKLQIGNVSKSNLYPLSKSSPWLPKDRFYFFNSLTLYLLWKPKDAA